MGQAIRPAHGASILVRRRAVCLSDAGSVDTRADPPRSIWSHPFDDPIWQRENAHKVSGDGAHTSHGDAKHHGDVKSGHHASGSGHAAVHSDAPHASGSGSSPHHRSIGEKLKDKLTGCVVDAAARS